MTCYILKLAGLLLTTTGASAALAHDFFLMPQNFRMSGPDEIDVQATMSSDFPRAANVVTADRAAATEAQGPGQPSLRVVDPLPQALNLKLTASREGLIAAAVRTVPREVEYTGDRIGIILEEYNVGPAAKAAVERLSAPRTLRVSSRRFAKTLICAVRCSAGPQHRSHSASIWSSFRQISTAAITSCWPKAWLCLITRSISLPRTASALIFAAMRKVKSHCPSVCAEQRCCSPQS